MANNSQKKIFLIGNAIEVLHVLGEKNLIRYSFKPNYVVLLNLYFDT